MSGSTPTSSGASAVLTTKGDIVGFDTARKRIGIGSNDQVLTADSTDSNGIAWKTSSSGVDEDTTINPVNSTISDYTLPDSASSSSVADSVISGTTTLIPSVNSASNASFWSNGNSGSGVTYNLPSACYGLNLHSVKLYFSRHSETTSGVQLQILDSSNSLRHTCTTTFSHPFASNGTFTTGTASNFVINSGDKIRLCGYGGGNGTVYYYIFSSINYEYTIDNQATYVASNVYDNATGDNDICKTTSETNPFISVGLSTSNEINQVAIYLDSDNTETEFQIQTSPDNSTWTTKRTITTSNLTSGQWNYIRFNNHNSRYLKVKGSSGLSKVMSIREIKVLTESLHLNHGHSVIDPTDTSLGLNGMSS